MMYDLKDEKQAAEYLKNVSIEYRYNCYKEKSAEGCHRLADFLESVKKEFDKAAKVYQTNCDDNKYGHSCFKFANYNILGKGRERDDKEALKYYMKGCEDGYFPACFSAGLMHSSSTFKLQNMEKSLQFFKKGCENGHVPSCYQISGIYISGNEHIPRDMKRAFDYSEKACEMGHMYACANLSQMYKKGEGVGQNANLAEKYRKKAKEIHESHTQHQKTLKFSE